MPSSLASTGRPSPLDYGQLLERCLGNAEFAQRILAKFTQKFVEDLERLEQSMAAGDEEAVGLLAHRLKGSAANVAAPALANLFDEIEQHSRQGGMPGIAERIAAVHEEWARFIAHAEEMPKA